MKVENVSLSLCCPKVLQHSWDATASTGDDLNFDLQCACYYESVGDAVDGVSKGAGFMLLAVLM